jgi:hypothetical protein
MTKKDFEIILKALQPELHGFAVKDRLLFIQPVLHTLRAIFFDRSIDARGFYVQIFVQPLFIPAKHIGFNVGWRLGGGSHLWNANAPSLVTDLSAELKREALPFLSRIKSPRDVAEAAIALHKSNDPYVQQVVAYSLARSGDIGKATTELDRLISMLNVNEPYPWQRELIERAEALKRKLLANPANALCELETWEVETAKNLGLEKYR